MRPLSASLYAVLSLLALAATGHSNVALARPPHTARRPEIVRTKTTEAPAPAASAASLAVSDSPRSPDLPRGGRTIFPRFRLVGFCGTPGAPALGRLLGNLENRAKTVESYAEKYGGDREVLPVFELIAVVVQGGPGADGKHRRRVPMSVVDDYLKAARAARALLLLNIQPGHSDFVTEVRAFEKYLKEPDVGVALDPEWAMKPRQKPGVYYGQTTGEAVNEVTGLLAEIVREHHLPEKVLVVHQVNDYVLKNEAVLKSSPGVVLVKSVDGLGPKGTKITTYRHLVHAMAADVHAGFKLFFDEDQKNGGKLMSATEVLGLTPKPEYVMYE